MQDKLNLIAFFEFLRDKEASKPLDEMNPELVDNYVKILLTLQDKHHELSPDFIDEQVRKIFHKDEKAAPETEKNKKNFVKNKIWLVAACIAILVALFSIVSFSSERSVKDVLEDFIGTFEFIPFGKEIDIDNETYGKGCSARTYKSIEELSKAEKIDLLYPSDINETIKLIAVADIDGKETINISYDNPDLSITITLNSNLPQEIIDVCNKKTNLNGIEYYLCIMKDIEQTQTYFTYNNSLYRIIHTDEKTLMEILNNMEEIKYED